MVIHQVMEHAHGRMALKLTVDIVLRRLTPFFIMDDFCQHQFRSGTGIFIDATLEEFRPGQRIAKVLIAFLQHRQRFADQLFILLQHPL
ncbi:hypothetical protein D3C73_1540360 [compost metagenome]